MTRRQLLGLMAGAALCPMGCKSVWLPGKELRIATWGGAGDDDEYARLQKRLYREFESAHPGLKLRVEAAPDSQEHVRKVLLDYIAGAMPDIVNLDASSAAVFIDNGTLMDLTPFIDRDPAFRLDDYYPNVVDVARRGKSLFAIPTDFTPMVVYLNRKLFREAGVPVPTGQWSFEKFQEIAKALTRPGVYGFEFANWMPGWVMFLWNNGSDVLAPDGSRATGFFDSPKSVEAVQYLADLVNKYRVAPSLSQSAATGVDFFATARAAMKVSGHWYIVALKAAKDIDMDDIAVVELPTNLEHSVTVMYEAGQAIGKGCKHPEEAWEWLKFWASYGVQKRYNASGIAVCGRKDVEEEKLRASRGTDLERAFQSIVPSARPPWGSRVEGYDRVEDVGQKAMDAVLKNNVPVHVAVSKAAHDIDAEFSKR